MSDHKLTDPNKAMNRILKVAASAGVSGFEDDAVSVAFALKDLAKSHADAQAEIARLTATIAAKDGQIENACRDLAQAYRWLLDAKDAFDLPPDATVGKMVERAKALASARDELAVGVLTIARALGLTDGDAITVERVVERAKALVEFAERIRDAGVGNSLDTREVFDALAALNLPCVATVEKMSERAKRLVEFADAAEPLVQHGSYLDTLLGKARE